MSRHFSKEDTSIDNKHMQRYSTSLPIREIQVKTTVRYHSILTRMAVPRKQIIKRVGKNVEKLEHSHTAGGNVKQYKQKVASENSLAIPQKFEHRVII